MGPVEGAHSASADLWHDSARRRPRDGHGVANDHWDRVLDILAVAVWHVPSEETLPVLSSGWVVMGDFCSWKFAWLYDHNRTNPCNCSSPRNSGKDCHSCNPCNPCPCFLSLFLLFHPQGKECGSDSLSHSPDSNSYGDLLGHRFAAKTWPSSLL